MCIIFSRLYTNCTFLYSNPQEKDEAVIEQTDTSNKNRRRKKKIKINDPNVKFINTVSKKKIMNIAENNAQNNSHGSKNDEKDERKKNVVNKDEKQKRENKLRTDNDRPSLKKMKTDKARREDPRIETDNVIKVENNGKIASLFTEKSTLARKKNKSRNPQLNKTKTGKRKSDTDDPMMFLEAERLKTYGISAKKLKNKLKYGNKKF